MFAVKQLLTVFFVFGILFGKYPVDGSRDSCPKPAIVDLTEETPDSSGAVNKSGILFPRDLIQYDHVGRFGCLCNVKICIPLCCPVGYAASSNGCVEDMYTPHADASKVQGYVDANGIFPFVHDPCQLSSIQNTSMKKYIGKHDQLPPTYDHDFRKICYFRKVDSMEIFMGICLDGISILRLKLPERSTAWHLTCDAVRGSFMMLALIVYSVTPELKNLQGLLLRCYIGSELTAITLCRVAPIGTTETAMLTYPVFLWIAAVATFAFHTATTFWLTVINFDVWWKFRTFRSNQHVNPKEYEKGRFMRYSIYTWGGSIILATIDLVGSIWLDVAGPLTASTSVSLGWTLVVPVALPFMICLFLFIYMFASTALTIRRQKKEIARAVNDVDRHDKDNMSQQRFNLYLGLFTLMGCYKVFYIPGAFWDLPTYEDVCQALGALHGILIFYILVWKDDVRRAFWSQVINVLHKCGVCRGPHPTPVVEDGNESL